MIFFFLLTHFIYSSFASSSFKELERYAFEQIHQTHVVLILHGGKILYQRTAPSISLEAPHPLWSISKSVTNALIGIAVHEGRLQLTDSICSFLKEKPPTPTHCSITIQSLLQMSSGLDWKESYEHEPPTRSSVMQMLYGDGRYAMADFVLGHSLASPPGTAWRYSSGDSLLLMRILQKIYSNDEYAKLPWSRLFERIGIKSAVWERDPAGTLIASSSLFMNARDLARFGELYLKDGIWAGARILPKEWVSFSKKSPASFFIPEHLQGKEIGAAQFWVNLPLLSPAGRKPWPDAPSDTFAALGHWGQSLWILPAENGVIVRLADDRDGKFDSNHFLKLAREGIRAAK